MPLDPIDLSTAPAVEDAASAEAFIRWCCRHIGLGFHPDNPMTEYQDNDNGKVSPSFNQEEAMILQCKLDLAYGLCQDPDVYAIGLDEFKKMRPDLVN